MAVSTQERNDIIKLVIGLMNVVPGASCLADAITSYEKNGRSLMTLARDLADTASYIARNPVSQTAAEFANALLTPLGLQHNEYVLECVTNRFHEGVAKGRIAYELVATVDASSHDSFKLARDILNQRAQS